MMRGATKLARGAACFVFGLLSGAGIATAGCDFSTYENREALSDPASIRHLGVEIHKSRKWTKNSLSILMSPDSNIDPQFKKKLDATLTVFYDFGQCEYPARVRQNGDWKDHIRWLSDGRMVSSLDVRLTEGNILNAVRFKLLLPDTRNGLNEVFATHLLATLGFVAPETFIVSADINGVAGPFLFQENAVKELLERNLRREGPIFEGDEDLLWGFGGFELFELEDISLARMTNGNWAEKGEVSREIALESFKRLQAAYLATANQLGQGSRWVSTIVTANPERHLSQLEDFGVLVDALDGSHALRPHNRKFYFNSFLQAFEPVYYDGNIGFRSIDTPQSQMSSFASQDFLYRHANRDRILALKDRIADLRGDEDFREEFLKRAGGLRDSGEGLVDLGISRILGNLDILEQRFQKNGVVEDEKFPNLEARDIAFLWEKIAVRDLGFDLVHVDKTDGADTYLATIASGPNQGATRLISAQELVRLLGNNKLDDRRTVVVPRLDAPVSKTAAVPFEGGEILVSEGSKIRIDQDQRHLVFEQTTGTDWILVREADLTGWKIDFVGVPQDPSLDFSQRFNAFGLTGCLNFYDVTLQDVSISGSDGQCEDSVNIVSSRGHLASLGVVDGFADAIDIDFSQIDIDRLTVTRTGNDCFDVSTGIFRIEEMRLTGCADKGISVGENSRFNGQDVQISGAVIGVSSKDYSTTRIARMVARDTEVCAEAFRKKQEFGGGGLSVDDFTCEGEINLDTESSIVLNGVAQ